MKGQIPVVYVSERPPRWNMWENLQRLVREVVREVVVKLAPEKKSAEETEHINRTTRMAA